MANNQFILKSTDTEWIINCGKLELTLSKKDGCFRKIDVCLDEQKTWSSYDGDVTVRDELLRKTFTRDDLASIDFVAADTALTIRKTFRGAPWTLTERYHADGDALCWESSLHMESGEYRTCAVSWNLPQPQPVFPVEYWTAKENMPTGPYRHAGLTLEYGEICSGTTFPCLSVYSQRKDMGILLTMPFDFKTPRLKFVSGFREKDLNVEFDFLALTPERDAVTKLLLVGTVGHWRPALGWLYERYKDYFEPRSNKIDALWGGHISGNPYVSDQEADDMKTLGMKWYEVHGHFPAYGNYHPEGMESWRSGHFTEDETIISVDMIHKTIKTLHDRNICAFPYLQVTGDGCVKNLPDDIFNCRIKNRRGEYWSGWIGTQMMNSDLSLPFGKDMTRQINGIVERYPEMDGIFLDQPCYNFIDTNHSDGMTAIDNKPAYMSGFSYYPHLEHLSSLIHPEKSIIANGPFSVGILKFFDAYMSEADTWLDDHLQYYGIGTKPMFILCYDMKDAAIEKMFQEALYYGACFTSYPGMMPSKDLFDLYIPLLEKLYRRRWIFDADPIHASPGFRANIFRSERGTVCVPILRTMARITRNEAKEGQIEVRTSDIASIRKVTLTEVGKEPVELAFERNEKGYITFTLDPDFVAGLVELQ